MVNIFLYVKSFKSLYGLTKVTSFRIAVIGLLFVGRAWATLGPSAEYNECVLEKMRGQVVEVLPLAHRLCESLFPYRKTIYRNGMHEPTKRGLENMSWDMVIEDGSTTGVVFTENRSPYILDSIKLGFGKRNSDGHCAPIEKVKTLDFKTDRGTNFQYAYEELSEYRFECVNIYEVWGKRKFGE